VTLEPRRRRTLQVVVVTALAAASAALVLASVLGTVKQVRVLIAPRITYTGSAVVVLLAVGAHLILRRWPQPWRFGQADSMLTGLTGAAWAPVIGALVLLWLPRAIDLLDRNQALAPQFFPSRIGTTWTYTFGARDTTDRARSIREIKGTYSESIVSVDSLRTPVVRVLGIRRSGKAPLFAPCTDNSLKEKLIQGDVDYWLVSDAHRVYYICDHDQISDVAAGLLKRHKQRSSDALPDYVLPFKAGDVWTAFPDAVPSKQHAYEWFVERKLDVDVPAGHFTDCYKLVLYTSPDQTIRWVCPRIGVVALEYMHHGTVIEERAELSSFLAAPG